MAFKTVSIEGDGKKGHILDSLVNVIGIIVYGW